LSDFQHQGGPDDFCLPSAVRAGLVSDRRFPTGSPLIRVRLRPISVGRPETSWFCMNKSFVCLLSSSFLQDGAFFEPRRPFSDINIKIISCPKMASAGSDDGLW